MGELIPLFRLKVLDPHHPERWAVHDKAPAKARDLRSNRPAGRVASREADAVGPLAALKDHAAPRRRAKLRFFRMFKLLSGAKEEPAPAPLRELDESWRRTHWMRRL
jgi:hypothetical protein